LWRLRETAVKTTANAWENAAALGHSAAYSLYDFRTSSSLRFVANNSVHLKKKINLQRMQHRRGNRSKLMSCISDSSVRLTWMSVGTTPLSPGPTSGNHPADARCVLRTTASLSILQLS